MLFIFWIVTPIFAVMLSHIMFSFIETFILSKEDAIERMIIFIPFQIAFTAFFMTFLLVVK